MPTFVDNIEPEDESTENNTYEEPTEDEIAISRGRSGSGGSDKDLSTQPVDNALEVPLFSDAGKRGIKSIAYIEVTKINQPGTGYKGKLPPSATKETIYQLYGNGVYNLLACNHKHVKLRELMEVRIDIPDDENEKPERMASPSGLNNNQGITDLIRSQHIRQEKELERTERLAMRSADDAKLQAQTYVELVKTTTESAALRDREHMKGVNDAQSAFMQGMLLSMQQGFQQQMAMLSAGHAMTLQIITAANKDKRDPMEMLLAGMRLAKEMGNGEDDSPDWLKAIDKGVNGIGHLVTLATKPPAMQMPTGIAKEKELPPSTEKPPSKRAPKIANPNSVKLTVSEAEKILQLKARLNANGMDFDAMLKATLEAPLDSDIYSEDSEDTEDLEESENPVAGNESRTTNMDG